jgi:deoxycytidine triphosphate deaminase
MGTLPLQDIARLVRGGHISAAHLAPTPPGGSSDTSLDRQLQPASFDLTLGCEAWQLSGSILPLRSECIRRDWLQNPAIVRQSIDLSRPTLLDRNKVYLVALRERFALPHNVAACKWSQSGGLAKSGG